MRADSHANLGLALRALHCAQQRTTRVYSVHARFHAGGTAQLFWYASGTSVMDWSSAGVIVALCVAAVFVLYLLGACGSAPLLSRTRKNAHDGNDKRSLVRLGDARGFQF